jgi:hypothetical protein
LASTPLWGKILGWFKGIKWKDISKKVFDKIGKKTDAEILNENEVNPDNIPLEVDETGNSKMYWIIGGIAVVGVGAYVVLKK